MNAKAGKVLSLLRNVYKSVMQWWSTTQQYHDCVGDRGCVGDTREKLLSNSV